MHANIYHLLISKMVLMVKTQWSLHGDMYWSCKGRQKNINFVPVKQVVSKPKIMTFPPKALCIMLTMS